MVADSNNIKRIRPEDGIAVCLEDLHFQPIEKIVSSICGIIDLATRAINERGGRVLGIGFSNTPNPVDNPRGMIGRVKLDVERPSDKEWVLAVDQNLVEVEDRHIVKWDVRYEPSQNGS